VSLKSLSPRLVTDLLLTRGVVDATPFAVAFSLTFSLVKNLKMLLQAKRQPGYKIPGRVVDRAYWFYDTNDKKWVWKIERNNLVLQLAVPLQPQWPLSTKKIPLNYQMQNFKSKMQVKDFKKNMNVTIFNPNKSLHGKMLVKMLHKNKSGHEKKMICCKLTSTFNQHSSIRKS
jgi:hypothetical protein